MDSSTILIIEDDVTQRLILEATLKPLGYRIAHAGNGNQGLKIMKKRRPDLILLDIEMPVMNGFQTIDEIKKRKAFENIPIIFLTVQNRNLQKIKGLDSGADDYITKPFDREELIARIKAVLRRSNKKTRMEDLEGNLGNVDLLDLLQNMENGSKTASIRIKEIDSEILIEYGSLIHIRCGSLTGGKALARILSEGRGMFSVRFNELPVNIKKNPQSLRSVLIDVQAVLEFDEESLKKTDRTNLVGRIKKALRMSESLVETDGVMKGYLHDIDLSGIMQNMKQDFKTGIISLEDIDAELYMQNGSLLHVRQGTFTGDRALTRIFCSNMELLPSGSVNFPKLYREKPCH